MNKASNAHYSRSKLLSHLPDWLSLGLISETIKEASVPLLCENTSVQSLQAIEMYNISKGTSSYPLTAVDIISNSYLRLSYQKSDGSSATLGSSLVGAISFRTLDNVLNFIPKINNAVMETTQDLRPLITISGSYGELAHIITRRKYLVPNNTGSSCLVEVNFKAQRDIYLAKQLLGKDAFRFCTISSMYTANCYDGNMLEYSSDTSEVIVKKLTAETKRGSYIFNKIPAISSMIALKKDSLSCGGLRTPGAIDSPSLQINFFQNQHLLGIQGYLAPSLDINSDSLSVWLEWKDAPKIIRSGQTISFSYTVTAMAPSLDFLTRA